MPASHRNFGNLLEEGIKRVHITRKKPIGYILDEFGYELRPDDSSKGRHALGHWYYKKRIPAGMDDVAKLASLIVANSDVERSWLKAFLDSAGYPDSDKFCDQFFLSTSKGTVLEEQSEAAAIPSKLAVGDDAGLPVKRNWSGFLYIFGFVILLLVIFLLTRQWQTAKLNVGVQTSVPVPSQTTQPKGTTEIATDALVPLPATSTPFITPTAYSVFLDGSCPALSSGMVFEYTSPQSFQDFLNRGGSFTELKNEFDTLIQKKINLRDGKVMESDLNSDGVSEILISAILESGSIWQILGCSDGKYQLLFDLQESEPSYLRFAVDLNKDKFPEVVTYRQSQADSISLSRFFIQAWNGQQIVDLMDNTRFDAIGTRLPADIPDWKRDIPNATGTTIDTNGDGIFELVITGGLTTSSPTCETRFERQFTETWAWNGRSFQLAERIYSPPTYRYQRSADGDLAYALNQLDSALVAYQDVLFAGNLMDRDEYLSSLEYCRSMGSSDGIRFEDERDQLAAYARWRILLINTLQGSQDAAQVVYQTLQEKFPDGKPGHVYAVIATAFWEKYQTTQDLSEACAAATMTAKAEKLHPAHKAENICFTP